MVSENWPNKEKFEAMRLAVKHPEKAPEIAKALEAGLPVDGGIPREPKKDEKVLPAKRKNWMKEREDKEDGIE